MKLRIYFLLFATSIIIACSNQDYNVFECVQKETTKNKNDIRNYAEALVIAQASISMLEESNSHTRLEGVSRIIDLNDRKVFKLDAKTRTNSDINDTLIYIFNFEDNAGFALVSASKNTEGLLAITEQGHCDPNTPTDIWGFERFKEMAKEYVRRSQEQKETWQLRTPDGPIVETKDSITYSFSQVGPYVTVKWGQENPEGEFCPNGYAGCANTAMAQIMSYYNQPTSINITYDGSYSTLGLNWSNMKAHATGHTISSCSTTNTHIMIARLLRQLGELNHSFYLDDGTGTFTDIYADSTFLQLGYNCGSWSSYTSFYARNQLNNAHLYLVRGTCSEGSHVWVFDGYKTRLKTIRKMARTATSGWFFTGEVTTETDYFIHLNWGSYGNCNGYFAEGVYNTTQAFSYDTGTNNLNHNFNTDIQFLNVYH